MPHAVDPSRAAQHGGAVLRLVDEIFPLVEGFYVDLHKNPELSHREFRTASAVAEWLRNAGFEVTTGVGGTGVVGVLRNGDGPTVMLRADMDALPVEEKTGLPYASTARGTDEDGNDVPVMHACGHDVHTACLVGTADLLASSRGYWSGTLLVVAQPAEETIDGAAAMLQDGLYTRFGRPDVVLAQHVGPQPAGMVSHRPGIILAATATLRIRVFGTGGHASQPHTTVDPVLIAANIVSRVQGVISREVSPGEMAVATVGVLRAGTKANIIPDDAYLEINTRSLNPAVADRLIASISRVVRAEAEASGAPREPEIEVVQQVGVTDNDPEQTAGVAQAHRAYFGDDYVIELPEPFTGSEDVGVFGLPGDPDPVPYVYWFVGGTPYDVWQAAPGETPYEKLAGVPGNHSPFFAPEREATLRSGLAALTVGALAYLAKEEDAAPVITPTGGQAPLEADPTGAQAPMGPGRIPPTEGVPAPPSPPPTRSPTPTPNRPGRTRPPPSMRTWSPCSATSPSRRRGGAGTPRRPRPPTPSRSRRRARPSRRALRRPRRRKARRSPPRPRRVRR
ncbi:amidohydrolase [Nocardiopsis composta]